MSEQEFTDWIKQEWDELRTYGYDRFLMSRYREIRAHFKEQGYDISEVRQYEKDNPL